MKYCVNCGHELPDYAAFCSNCGTKQPEAQTSQQQEPNNKVKQKTSFANYAKPSVYILWGCAPLLMLTMNIILSLVGGSSAIPIIMLYLFSVLGIVVNLINFIKRIKAKGKLNEIVTNGVLVTIDFVCIICAVILIF